MALLWLSRCQIIAGWSRNDPVMVPKPAEVQEGKIGEADSQQKQKQLEKLVVSKCKNNWRSLWQGTSLLIHLKVHPDAQREPAVP